MGDGLPDRGSRHAGGARSRSRSATRRPARCSTTAPSSAGATPTRGRPGHGDIQIRGDRARDDGRQPADRRPRQPRRRAVRGQGDHGVRLPLVLRDPRRHRPRQQRTQVLGQQRLLRARPRHARQAGGADPAHDRQRASSGSIIGTTAAGAKRKAVALGGGYQSTCVLGDDGAVSCWGTNGSGQLGIGVTGQPALVRARRGRRREPGVAGRARGRRRRARAGGGRRGARLRAARDRRRDLLGRKRCRTARHRRHDARARVLRRRSSFGDGFAPAAARARQPNTCAISADKRVKCWGSNRARPARSRRRRRSPRRPVPISGCAAAPCARSRLATITRVRSCDGGALKCWGRNTAGPARPRRPHQPRRPAGPDGRRPRRGRSRDGPAIAVAAGAAHTCAVTRRRRGRVLGRGRGGSARARQRRRRARPPGAARSRCRRRRRRVVAGADFSCALLSERPGGLLGHRRARPARHAARRRSRAAPGAARSRSTAKATALAAGGAPRLRAARERQDRVLGRERSAASSACGDTQDRRGAAVVLRARTRARRRGGRLDTTCVLLDGGAVRCWGANDRGQLGLGDARGARHAAGRRRSRSARVGTRAALAVGGAFACALLDTTQAKCWGDNRRPAARRADPRRPRTATTRTSWATFCAAAVAGRRALAARASPPGAPTRALSSTPTTCAAGATTGTASSGPATPRCTRRSCHPTGVVDLGGRRSSHARPVRSTPLALVLALAGCGDDGQGPRDSGAGGLDGERCRRQRRRGPAAAREAEGAARAGRQRTASSSNTPSGRAATETAGRLLRHPRGRRRRASGQSVDECANPRDRRASSSRRRDLPDGQDAALRAGTPDRRFEIGIADGTTGTATISATTDWLLDPGDPPRAVSSHVSGGVAVASAPRRHADARLPRSALSGACVTRGALDLRRARVTGFRAERHGRDLPARRRAATTRATGKTAPRCGDELARRRQLHRADGGWHLLRGFERHRARLPLVDREQRGRTTPAAASTSAAAGTRTSSRRRPSAATAPATGGGIMVKFFCSNTYVNVFSSTIANNTGER